MPYSFTPAHPPLLRDNAGDIFQIPSDDLEKIVGEEATWASTPAPGAGGAIVSKKFTVKRKLFWSISQIPHHYNTDQEVKVKYVTGFSKTRKESIEKNIGGDVGGSFFGLTAKIQASLKLTTDFTQEWHEETTIEATEKYAAGHTYCTWRLNDIIDLVVETATVAPGNPPVTTPTVIKDYIISVIAIYGDEAADQNQAIFKSAEQSHALTLVPPSM